MESNHRNSPAIKSLDILTSKKQVIHNIINYRLDYGFLLLDSHCHLVLCLERLGKFIEFIQTPSLQKW